MASTLVALFIITYVIFGFVITISPALLVTFLITKLIFG